MNIIKKLLTEHNKSTAQAQEILGEILTLLLDTSAELDLENPNEELVKSKARKINELSIKLLKALL